MQQVVKVVVRGLKQRYVLVCFRVCFRFYRSSSGGSVDPLLGGCLGLGLSTLGGSFFLGGSFLRVLTCSCLASPLRLARSSRLRFPLLGWAK